MVSVGKVVPLYRVIVVSATVSKPPVDENEDTSKGNATGGSSCVAVEPIVTTDGPAESRDI